MVRPACFAPNGQTAASNKFQNALPKGDAGSLQFLALAEFDRLVLELKSANVEVHVCTDTATPRKPDAIFPNNWLTTHEDGRIVLYPLLAENRRLERRLDLVDYLRRSFCINSIVDFSHFEREQKYLEGTGSLVLDRVHQIAYACVSPRTHLDIAEAWAREFGYELVPFVAQDQSGIPIYHTNVILSVGTHFAIACVDAIDTRYRARVREYLQISGRQLVELNFAQIVQFAGNVLELRTRSDDLVLVMSSAARASLHEGAVDLLQNLTGKLISVSIPTIERYGGGSVRCMLAEIFLPPLS